MAYNIPDHLVGLNQEQIKFSRDKYGFNRMDDLKKDAWWQMLLQILKEPMLILLFAISFIYLVVGNYGEALFMLVAIVLVSAISFYQDNRSKHALAALEKLNEPLSKVIRDRQVIKM